MDRFNLEGFYKYAQAPNGKGRLTGELEVAADGSFEGPIYDHASMNPEQVIKGHITKQNGLEKMVFLKFPPSAHLANLSYCLQKKTNSSFEGTYRGQWGALPVKVQYLADYRLFVAQIDMSMCSIGDSAQIKLTRK